jgi:hypothetical protein
MKIIALSLPLALLAAASVHADVLYQFTGTYAEVFTGNPTPASFTLTLPSPVLSDAVFFPGPDLVCDGCSQINFFTDFFPGTDTIGYSVPAHTASYYFYYTPDAFVTDGVHAALSLNPNFATLTVSGVPEPSAFWLLLSAVAAILTIRGAVAAIRRTRPRSPTVA